MKNLIVLGFLALLACQKQNIQPSKPLPPKITAVNDTIDMYVYSCKFDSLFTLYPYDQVIIESFNGATMTDSVLLSMGTSAIACKGNYNSVGTK